MANVAVLELAISADPVRIELEDGRDAVVITGKNKVFKETYELQVIYTNKNLDSLMKFFKPNQRIIFYGSFGLYKGQMVVNSNDFSFGASSKSFAGSNGNNESSEYVQSSYERKPKEKPVYHETIPRENITPSASSTSSPPQTRPQAGPLAGLPITSTAKSPVMNFAVPPQDFTQAKPTPAETPAESPKPASNNNEPDWDNMESPF